MRNNKEYTRNLQLILKRLEIVNYICFLMDLNDGTLSITASDSETTLTTSIEVNESDANGRFAVNSKTILENFRNDKTFFC